MSEGEIEIEVEVEVDSDNDELQGQLDNEDLAGAAESSSQDELAHLVARAKLILTSNMENIELYIDPAPVPNIVDHFCRDMFLCAAALVHLKDESHDGNIEAAAAAGLDEFVPTAMPVKEAAVDVPVLNEPNPKAAAAEKAAMGVPQQEHGKDAAEEDSKNADLMVTMISSQMSLITLWTKLFFPSIGAVIVVIGFIGGFNVWQVQEHRDEVSRDADSVENIAREVKDYRDEAEDSVQTMVQWQADFDAFSSFVPQFFLAVSDHNQAELPQTVELCEEMLGRMRTENVNSPLLKQTLTEMKIRSLVDRRDFDDAHRAQSTLNQQQNVDKARLNGLRGYTAFWEGCHEIELSAANGSPSQAAWEGPFNQALEFVKQADATNNYELQRIALWSKMLLGKEDLHEQSARLAILARHGSHSAKLDVCLICDVMVPIARGHDLSAFVNEKAFQLKQALLKQNRTVALMRHYVKLDRKGSERLKGFLETHGVQ